MNGVSQMFIWPTVQMLIGVWTMLHAAGTFVVMSLPKNGRGQNIMFLEPFRCNMLAVMFVHTSFLRRPSNGRHENERNVLTSSCTDPSIQNHYSSIVASLKKSLQLTLLMTTGGRHILEISCEWNSPKRKSNLLINIFRPTHDATRLTKAKIPLWLFSFGTNVWWFLLCLVLLHYYHVFICDFPFGRGSIHPKLVLYPISSGTDTQLLTIFRMKTLSFSFKTPPHVEDQLSIWDWYCITAI